MWNLQHIFYMKRKILSNFQICISIPLTQSIMVVLSKGCKPDNFESHNSLKLGFMNIWGLRSNFVDCKSFLESNSPNILALCETNLNDSLILTISVWRISSKHFLFFSVTIFGLSRCLQAFFARRFQAVFKTSSILLPKRLLQVVLKTSWRRLEDEDLQLCLEDAFEDKKCCSEDVLKTSSPRGMFDRSYFNRKGFQYSYAWSCSLCEGTASFCRGRISSKICRFLLTFSNGFTSLSFLLPFPLSITFCVFIIVFNYISSNVDELLSINPSARVFVFGDFNVHHK